MGGREIEFIRAQGVGANPLNRAGGRGIARKFECTVDRDQRRGRCAQTGIARNAQRAREGG